MQFHWTDNRARLWVIVISAGVALAMVGSASIAFVHPVVPFAVIIGVIVGAILLSDIDYGMYALIAITVLLPFAALPLNIGFNPTFLDLALVAVYAICFARIMTRQNEGGFVATGRHIYAVGGNVEAARRAGVQVDRIRVSVFVLTSLIAAIAGVLAASRLTAVNLA